MPGLQPSYSRKVRIALPTSISSSAASDPNSAQRNNGGSANQAAPADALNRPRSNQNTSLHSEGRNAATAFSTPSVNVGGASNLNSGVIAANAASGINWSQAAIPKASFIARHDTRLTACVRAPTVTAMAYAIDDPSLRRATDVSFFVAGGPGGQHRNKTSTGVRLRHRPSGVRVQATERRSQARNLATAWERLRARLDALNFVPAERKPTRPPRGAAEARMREKAHASDRKRSRRRPADDG